jgi:hypothetical protein
MRETLIKNRIACLSSCSKKKKFYIDTWAANKFIFPNLPIVRIGKKTNLKTRA